MQRAPAGRHDESIDGEGAGGTGDDRVDVDLANAAGKRRGEDAEASHRIGERAQIGARPVARAVEQREPL
jgi:hypothetical protein